MCYSIEGDGCFLFPAWACHDLPLCISSLLGLYIRGALCYVCLGNVHGEQCNLDRVLHLLQRRLQAVRRRHIGTTSLVTTDIRAIDTCTFFDYPASSVYFSFGSIDPRYNSHRRAQSSVHGAASSLDIEGGSYAWSQTVSGSPSPFERHNLTGLPRWPTRCLFCQTQLIVRISSARRLRTRATSCSPSGSKRSCRYPICSGGQDHWQLRQW